MATGHVGGEEGNPTEQQVTEWMDKLVQTCKGLFDADKLQCWIIGKEKGGQTNRWHLQCFFKFGTDMSTRRSLKWVQEHIYQAAEPTEDESLRFFQADGTAQQNFEYCSKDSVYEHQGDFATEQGKRNDLLTAQTYAKENFDNPDCLLGLYENHFSAMVRYGRGFGDYMQLLLEKQRRNKGYARPDVFVFVGPTGTGKSRRAEYEATKRCGAEHVFFKSVGSWYDGYRGHKAVIVNEFTGAGMPLSEFQQITDGYPYRVPIKGAFYVWKPEVIYITSNVHPDNWWSEARLQEKNKEIWPSIRRRIKVTVFRGEWRPPTESAPQEGVPSTSGGDSRVLQNPNQEILAPETPEFTANQQGMDFIEEISDDSDF